MVPSRVCVGEVGGPSDPMGDRQGLRATAWAESVGKEIGVASGTACRPRIGRGRLEAKRQLGCDSGVLADRRGAFAVWRERLWERVVGLGTFRGCAPPPRRRPRASNTSGRGAKREGGRARSCAATRGTAARGSGKGARRWAGSAAPRALRRVGALAFSRCHGHEPSIFGLSFLPPVP